jgi:hypothetical protein
MGGGGGIGGENSYETAGDLQPLVQSHSHQRQQQQQPPSASWSASLDTYQKQLQQQYEQQYQRSKVRQIEAWETYVARAIHTRQSYRSQTNIRNLMAARQRKREMLQAIAHSGKEHEREQRLMYSQANQYRSKKLAANDRIANVNSKSMKTLNSLLLAAKFYEDDSKEDDYQRKVMTPAEELFKNPMNVHFAKDRNDILESVQIRKELAASLRHEKGSWNEYKLIDDFILGRMHARMRRSRNQQYQNQVDQVPYYHQQSSIDSSNSVRQSSFSSSVTASKHRSRELMGGEFRIEDDGSISLSTSAEENEAALSEALLENFGLSLTDDYHDVQDWIDLENEQYFNGSLLD